MESLRPGDPAWVGHYELIGRLGAGGMGTVFLGKSPGGRQVAVKLIRPELADGAHFRARFRREIAAVRKVGGFHTAPVVDADPDADPPWLVTAYIPGPSLQDLIDRSGPMPAAALRSLGAGLAEGLGAVHACGLVHRDLKPGNVIMAQDGPRVIDFGIVQDAGDGTLTAAGAVLGTYAYMSPEQVSGRPAGTASDVWAFGCVLAYAATGRNPFAAPVVPALVNRILHRPPDLRGVPVEFFDLIAACLAKDPGARPTVADCLSRLAGTPADARLTVPQATRAYGPRTRRPSRRSLLAGGIAAGGLAAAVPVALLLHRGQASGVAIPPRKVEGLGFSTDGKRLLCFGGTDRDTVWMCGLESRSITSHSLTRDFKAPAGDVIAAVSPDIRAVAGADGNTVRVWDLATGEATVTLTGHTDRIRTVVFSKDRRLIATTSMDLTVRIWDGSSGHIIASGTITDTEGDMAFSPDGSTLVITGFNRMRLMDTASGRITATLNEYLMRTPVFAPDGRSIVFAGTGTRQWDMSGNQATSFGDGGQTVDEVAVSPDGRFVASARAEAIVEQGQIPRIVRKGVRLWDRAGRIAIADLPATARPPLAFGPDGRTLATGGAVVLLWNTGTGRLIRQI